MHTPILLLHHLSAPFTFFSSEKQLKQLPFFLITVHLSLWRQSAKERKCFIERLRHFGFFGKCQEFSLVFIITFTVILNDGTSFPLNVWVLMNIYTYFCSQTDRDWNFSHLLVPHEWRSAVVLPTILLIKNGCWFLQMHCCWPHFLIRDPAEFREVHAVLPHFLVMSPVTLMSLTLFSWLSYMSMLLQLATVKQLVAYKSLFFKDDLRQKTIASSPDFYF